MGRQKRIISGDGIYYVAVKGSKATKLFREHEDYERLLSILLRYKNSMGFKLYGYCLLESEVHLVLNESDVKISEIMKKIEISYVMWFNYKYKRTGPLFYGRFKSKAISGNELENVIRFIHQLPFNHRMCKGLVYDYSSYKDFVYRSEHVLLDLAPIFKQMSLKDFISSSYVSDKGNYDVKRLSDEALKRVLYTRFRISKTADFRRYSDRDKKRIVGLLKANNCSIRQATRVLGESYYYIRKIFLELSECYFD